MTRARHDDPRLTIEEYAVLDEPDAVRSELVDGRLVREPRPAAPHGRVQTLLAHLLNAFVEEHGLGTVLTDAGVVIDEESPTVRGPDVMFVSRERLPGSLPDGFLRVAPDLAVEIVSPANSVSSIQAKVIEYLHAGVRMVWVVDPTSRTATVYRSRRDGEILGEDDELPGGDVLPELRLRLDSVLPAGPDRRPGR